MTLLIGMIAFIGYVWTQQQYYVGEDDGEVAIYNGVSQQLGPISLSEVNEHSGIPLQELSFYERERLRSGIPADDRRHAEQIVETLRADADLPENADLPEDGEQ
ncbi:BofC C-terminal domain-containing protein [Nesterenkonia pannonica]|uniref:BofC C-terminal domain-containing protein n=1 Tax=Nesterenkonia pannonica TaxID=1548602 RepID=UPI0021648E6B|nr:BofC C-terminal domain-containing protein [Nesterenkonia pannonica]